MDRSQQRHCDVSDMMVDMSIPKIGALLISAEWIDPDIVRDSRADR